MIVIFAVDALEYDLVEELGCRNLMQGHYGKTDISEFSQPRTMVLWSSFMTGKNKEKDVLKDGNREMWEKKWDIRETFFSMFKNPVILDLPGFSYDLKEHKKSRELLKAFFDAKDNEEKEKIREKYNQDAFAHHRKIKKEFLKAIENGHDIVLGYFSIADVIGHLSFGKRMVMRMIYNELDEIAGTIKNKCEKLIILSDHGMKAVGVFGDHSEYGFWSTNFRDLGTPKITDFYSLIKGMKS